MQRGTSPNLAKNKGRRSATRYIVSGRLARVPTYCRESHGTSLGPTPRDSRPGRTRTHAARMAVARRPTRPLAAPRRADNMETAQNGQRGVVVRDGRADAARRTWNPLRCSNPLPNYKDMIQQRRGGALQDIGPPSWRGSCPKRAACTRLAARLREARRSGLDAAALQQHLPFVAAPRNEGAHTGRAQLAQQ